VSSFIQKGALPFDGGCRFVVWAPNADAVFVIGDFNDWNDTAHPLARSDDGWWSGEVAEAAPGGEYRYRIERGGESYSKIDPHARRVTSSVGNGLIPRPYPGDPPPAFTPPALNAMVIYELHIGTFGKQPPGEDGPSDIESAKERLAYLHDLGINCIEVMPIVEFAGDYSWGYNPSHIFAVDSAYGTRHDFREFVIEAHRLGIAVIVDVVYNHLGPSDLDLWQFDGWHENGKGGIYFYNDHRAKTPWGDTRPDYGRPEVREFIRDNALYWFEELGVDGLRWDATSYIRRVDGHDDGAGGGLPDGWSLMQWVNDEMRRLHPKAFSIAEDLQSNPHLTIPAEHGGAGFNAQWDARFVHPIRAALVHPDDDQRDMQAVFDALTFRYADDAFTRVIYTESHDEVANGKARVPEEVDPGKAESWAARKKSALGAALVFTAPGIPMIFQAQEFLAGKWFDDQNPIDWSRKERFGGILAVYRDLIALRLNRHGNTAGLQGHHIEVFHINQDDKVVAYHRWAGAGPGDSVVVVANFSTRAQTGYTIGLPFAGTWIVRCNTDSQEYDPEFTNAGGTAIEGQDPNYDDLPFHGVLDIGPYSALILSQDGG
jgi:1,4-alpha-glucan branching enzyme